MAECYLSDRQAAARYGVSRVTWWRWVRAGNAPRPVKLGPNTTRWHADDLASWERQRAEAAA